jgi:lipoprotein-anchoring transpeptidase ErfK/SrfK
MRGRLALIAMVSALLLAGALVALVYADQREDRLPSETTVAGVDVGGLEEAAATQRVEQRLDEVARAPLTLVHERKRIQVDPTELAVRADAEGLVAEALRRGRDGNPFGRALRDLTGSDAGIHVPLRITYSRRAVADAVERIADEIHRPPRAADVEFTRRGLRVTPSREGVMVRPAALSRAIVAALKRPGAGREVQVPVRSTPARRRSTEDLRDRYPLLIGVSRPAKELRLYRNLRLVKIYEIAVGQSGHRTKPGRYEILSKLKDPVWKAPREKWVPPRLRGKLIPPGSEDNPIEARWLGFAKGLGIHGTDDIASLGTRASHGCIRMSVPAVKEVFRRVKIGTPVFIV